MLINFLCFCKIVFQLSLISIALETMNKIVLIFSCLCLSVSLAKDLPTISFNDLKQNPASVSELTKTIGAFAIKETPLADEYLAALEQLDSDAPKCLIQSDFSAHKSILGQDVTRYTSAISSQENGKHPECVNVEVIQKTFDMTSHAVFDLISTLVGEMPTYFNNHNEDAISINKSPYLDHVHVYTKPREDKTVTYAKHTVPHHYDNGLFLLLTPSPEHPLEIIGDDQTVYEAGDGEIIVAFGRGIQDWLFQDSETNAKLFKPALHGVPSMLSNDRIDKTRTVYARMIVAPEQAVPHIQNK